MSRGIVLVLATLMALSNALNYHWNGRRMTFSDSANWQNGVAPVAPNAPCSTTFGDGNATIYTTLTNTEYIVGEVLNLPPNGALILSPDDTVITFTDFGGSCGASHPEAVWTGGIVPDVKNDFNCHLNWKLDDGSTATTPPCDGDAVLIEGDLPVKLFVPNNISLVVMQSITLGSGAPVTTNTTAALRSLMPQVDFLDTSAVICIGSNAYRDVCKPMWELALTGPTCSCYSTCPTPEMYAQDLNLERLNYMRMTNTSLNQIYVRPFTGTMTFSALFVTQSQLLLGHYIVSF